MSFQLMFRKFRLGAIWDLRHYWLMGLYTLMFHYPLLVPGIGMPNWGDFYCFHSPMRIAAAEALHQGHMPFITQALFGGYPLYQDPQFAFFYPVNFLFSLFVPNPNNEASLDGYILANLLILSASALYFVRSLKFGRAASLTAAIIICMNGFVQMHITHINILQVMATGFIAAGLLTKLAWSGGRNWRYALGAGVVLAAGNLAGHPQTTLFLHYSLGIGMLVLAGKYWQKHRDNRAVVLTMGWSAAAVIAGVAIAAVQLLPTAHLLSICSRISMSREEAMGEAMRLKHIPSMLFPGFYLPLPWQLHWPFFSRIHMHWIAPNPLESLSFFGTIACALGMVGYLGNLKSWAVQFVFWSAVLILGAAMGEQLPIYGWLYDYLPMVKVVRVPSRVLWIFYTAWALLAAVGVQNVLSGRCALGCRRTFWLVIFAVWISFLVVLGAYRNSWSEAFIHLFVQDHHIFDSGIRTQLPEFKAALQQQGIVGGIIVAAMAIWLFVVSRRRKGMRWAVAIVMFAMACELFYYGFARSYVIHRYAPTSVDTRYLSAFPGEVEGRAVVPSFIHGRGAINTAMQKDVWLANGYSVTYSDWVRAFEVSDIPPWQGEVDKKRFDLWNVSDIVVQRRSTMATIGGNPIALDDWGWKNIGSPWTADTGMTTGSARANMASDFSIDLSDLTKPVTALYVICTSEHTRQLPNGIEVARLTAVPTDGSVSSATFPLRMGENISDGWYNLPNAEKPNHDQADVTFVRRYIWEKHDGMEMYVAAYALPTTTTLRRLDFEATGPYPASVGISQVIVAMDDNSIIIKYPVEIGDFKEVASPTAEYRVLHRDTAPGFAWMVPSGMRGSYKKTDNIMGRLYNPAFDLRKQVIVDKKRYPTEQAHLTDADSPDDYESTCSVTWLRPEEVVVKTRTNDKGWAVISMTWDKGWSATLDGKPVILSRANGPHCAVPVPAGEHEIRLKYTPVYWWPGLLITCVGLVGCMGGLLWSRRRADARA